MRLKDLFVVPKGQRITDKYLYRVLVSSICSILLCMGCLAGTTWAWFTVSIENPGNVIQIGTPEVNITVDDVAFTSGSELSTGSHTVNIRHANDVDSFSLKSTLYVTLMVEKGTSGYTVLNNQNSYCTNINIVIDNPCKLSWEVSWFPPASAILLQDDTITVAEEKTSDTVETETESTEESVDATEAEKESTEESVDATETEVDPTDETLETTETEDGLL